MQVLRILQGFLNIYFREVKYLNYIDKDFRELSNLIKVMDLNEIKFNIKNNFIKLNSTTQSNIEKFLNDFLFWGRLDIKNGIEDEINNKANTLKTHIDDFIWMYNKLNDYTSKKVLYAILNNWLTYDFKNLTEIMDNRFFNYFDLDLIPFSHDEVIVDLGCYTGDTIIDYFKTYGLNGYRKIYCFDIFEDVLNKAKNNLKNFKNIEFIKKAICNHRGKVSLFSNQFDSSNRITYEGDHLIDSNTLDNEITEKITMIKMDIESSEYEALLGSKEHIKNDKPKLLISIYHGFDDVWRIIKLIDSFNSDYKYYLRYYGGPIFPTEITLIAI